MSCSIPFSDQTINLRSVEKMDGEQNKKPKGKSGKQRMRNKCFADIPAPMKSGIDFF